MELLILFALSGWGFGRYAANEAIGARHKTVPLRLKERGERRARAHQRKMTKYSRRGGRLTIAEAISVRVADRIANPRGGPARQAMAQWWGDSWGYATERRLSRHERARRGELRRQKAARAATGWAKLRWQEHRQRQADSGPDVTADAGTGPQTGGTSAANATPEAPTSGGGAAGGGAGPEPANTGQTAGPGPRQATTAPPPAAGPEQSATTAPGDTPGQAGVAQPDDVIDAEVVDDPDPADVIDAQVVDVDDLAQQASGAAPEEHHQQHTDGPLASVHPIHKEIAPMTSTISAHSVASGETLDPTQGHAFVSDIGSLAQDLATQIELSGATLQEKGVSGELVEDLHQMHEAAQTLAARSTSAAEHFARHIATQDQVLSDPSLAGTVDGGYLSGAHR